MINGEFQEKVKHNIPQGMPHYYKLLILLVVTFSNREIELTLVLCRFVSIVKRKKNRNVSKSK